MRTFVSFVLRFKLLVIIAMIGILAAGAWSATQLRQQLFPDIEFPFAVATVQAPGIPPGVLDEQVAGPLADSIADNDQVRTARTIASQGSVTIFAELDFGADFGDATDEVFAELRSVELPEGVGAIESQSSFSEQPALITTVAAEGNSLPELTERLAPLVADLEAIDGVAEVATPGAYEEQIQVQLSDTALRAGVTPAAVLAALGENPAELSTKEVNARVNEFVDTKIEDPLLPPNTEKVRAPHVIVQRGENPNAGFAVTNGEPSIALQVKREPDANEVGVVDDAREVLDAFNAENEDITAVTLSENASQVRASIKGLLIEGILGALGAVLVIFLFLRSGRGTLIAAVSIPTSLVFGLFVGYLLDLTLDIITLAGLTIAIGRVIDDAIVVIENISKHIERGEDAHTAVVEGTAEVSRAIASSTLATVAVFLPLGFLSGFVTSIFRSFSIIVAVALLASLLVAVTVIPVFAELMFKRRESALAESEEPFLSRTVAPATRFGLKYRWLTILVAVLSMGVVGGLLYSGAIPTQFLPDSSVQQVYGSVAVDPTLAGDDSRDQLDPLGEILESESGVTDWQYSYGASAVQTDFGPSAGSATFIANLDEDANGEKLVTRVREEGLETFERGFSIAQLENGPPSGTFQANLRADDPKTLQAAVDKTVQVLKSNDSLTEVSAGAATAEIPQLTVTPTNESDFSQSEVRALRQQAVAYSTPVTSQPSEGVSVLVTPPPSVLADPSAIEDLPFDSAGSTADPQIIGDVASVTREPQLAFISRSKGKLVVTVDALILDENTAGITEDVKGQLKKAFTSDNLKGVDVSYEGDAAFVEQMFSDLGKAMAIAVVLVFIMLAFAFRSLILPIAMFAPVLFSTFGAYVALALTGNALGLPALIGQLLLIGIVVANAILLVDAVGKHRRAGSTVHEALEIAARERVRPVLMTAFATIAALTPLAIGLSGEGGIISKSLGVVVIGGLLLATIGTLVIVPAAYSLLQRGKRDERRKREPRDGHPVRDS